MVRGMFNKEVSIFWKDTNNSATMVKTTTTVSYVLCSFNSHCSKCFFFMMSFFFSFLFFLFFQIEATNRMVAKSNGYCFHLVCRVVKSALFCWCDLYKKITFNAINAIFISIYRGLTSQTIDLVSFIYLFFFILCLYFFL